MCKQAIEYGGWVVVTGGASGVGLAAADRAFYLIERGNQPTKELIIVNVPVLERTHHVKYSSHHRCIFRNW